ncbi:hypothetical protein GCM10011490_18020 [Pseudoclavibacter endophyticus]|uniref:type II secretion system F family protein n=1 Tax=Pseudoclavibacter endophyticus TaxID=1778590 RepID=UPI0016695D29|nr:type II secretion system F family protein [Pseudoclavibacter endophyticus]GGA67832.1 hypothetical protein GCM10011490_18020 [Pseudoclavibacter endophyticus]
MSAILALLTALGVVGALLIVAGLVPARGEAAAAVPPRAVSTRWALRAGMRWSRRRRMLAAGGLAAGAVLWLSTGWVVFLVGVPLASLLLPAVFASGGARERLERLDALESWTRSLAGLTIAGAGLEQTISASLSSAGATIRPHVATLVARINARWRTAAALRSFADDVADATCDLIVMHLLLAERMRGPGLARALEDLADSISDEVRARRAIETDRAKPQQNMRIITVTTLLLLAVMPFAGTFMAPYSSPTGQLLLASWIAVYAAILVWMHRIARPPVAPRMLSTEVTA